MLLNHTKYTSVHTHSQITATTYFGYFFLVTTTSWERSVALQGLQVGSVSAIILLPDQLLSPALIAHTKPHSINHRKQSALGTSRCPGKIFLKKPNKTILYKHSTSLILKTGRHCCILCLIIQSQLKLPPERRSIPLRTLASLLSDHARFMQSGGNVKLVKEYNNAVLPPFFNIPLEQVHTYMCTLYPVMSQ